MAPGNVPAEGLASAARAPETRPMGWLVHGFTIGDCEVRAEDGTVLTPSGLRRLGPRPMALLLLLAAQPGKVFSREELMAEVWAGLVVSDETLSRCISDIRQALDDNRRAPRYIETLARRGYRLIEQPCPLTGDPDATSAAGVAGTTLPAGHVRNPGIRQAAPWLAASLALLLAVAGWLVTGQDTARDEPVAEAPLAENGIAVLPFANLSDDPELEYFSDGLSEELIHRLSGVEALAVVARTSAFAFKGRTEDIREIGRALGVAYVLEGSVRRQGDQVRIGAQLIDVRNGFHLFSRVYERPFSDLFAIQEHVALEVGAALEPRLAGLLEGLQNPPPETVPEALEAYLLGKHLQRKLTVGNLERAAREFRRAIEIDPGFARAYGDLAGTLALTSAYAEKPLEQFRGEIQALAARALELDPRSATAWHARGLLAYLSHDPDEAIEAFTTAQRLDPNAANSLAMLGRSLYYQGRNREALEYTTLALRKDPINHGIIHNHAALLGMLGQFDEAERWLRRSMEFEDDTDNLNTLWAMGGLKYVSGHTAEAARWLKRCIDLGGQQAAIRTQLGWALLELGDYAQSRRWIDDGLGRSTDPPYLLDVLLAWHYFQGDAAGLAEAVRHYSERFPDRTEMSAFRGLSALYNGDPATAVREYESLAGRDSELLNSPWSMMFGHWHALHLARARQLAGQDTAAARTLYEAEERLGDFEQEFGLPMMADYYRAAMASMRGERDRSIEFLEQAWRGGWRRHAQVSTSPLFAAVHDDQRLRVLLQGVQKGLQDERLALATEPGS
ncbi:MAG TPA: tetratricopeptide repeat protein [Woeseiaceae bacterium]|nr:tetratricopeptide repeat protein [Woeseiaceae bacterium]